MKKNILIYFFMTMLSCCGGGSSSNNEPPQEELVEIPTNTYLTVSEDTILIEWDSTTDAITNIERSSDGYAFVLIYEDNENNGSYTDTNLLNSTTYYYRLRNKKEENYSDYTEILSETILVNNQDRCASSNLANAVFVDGANICGTCSDSISKTENSIDNSWCTISKAIEQMEPGDNIYIREGTYREQITLDSSGIEGSPITIQSYQNEEVILDGSEVITNWQKCASQEQCGNNPNWESIYTAKVPADIASDTDALTANLFQENQLLSVSQEPDQPDNFYVDNIDYYYSVTLGDMTSISLTDATNLQYNSSTDLDDTYALLWVSHNRVFFHKIESYAPATSTITYSETANPPYDDRDGKYSLYNGIPLIDTAGEYSISYNLDESGEKTVYLWPLDGESPNNSNITISTRNYGININRQSHITIKGLTVQKYTGSVLTHGVGIGSATQGGNPQKIIVRDNIVRYNRHATRGYGGIYLSNCDYCVIENNNIYENLRHYGIFVSTPKHSKVKNNTISKPGQSCITHYYGENTEISGNELSGCSGTHANTITVYLDSKNVLIADNYIHDSRGSLTLRDCSNITLYNNIIDASLGGSCIDEWTSTSEDIHLFANNTFINSENNTALTIGNSGADYRFHNNIIDGYCPPDDANVSLSNNLYTGLMWCQNERYDWYLEDDSFIETDFAALFDNSSNINPLTGGLTPLEGSDLNENGTDISDLLPTDIFPDYNFEKDFNGNYRDLNAPGIGALE